MRVGRTKLDEVPSNFIAGRPKAALMFYLLLVVPFLFCILARFIAVVSFVLYMILAPFSPLIPPTRFAFCLCFIRLFLLLLFVLFCLLNQSRNKGEGWSTANLFKPQKIL